MKKLLCLLPLSLSLAGCPMMDGVMGSQGSTATGATSPMNVVTFISRLESARGSALGLAEKAAVGGAVTQTRGLIDAGQQRFLGVISQASGLDTGTLGVLFPPAAQPVSQTEAVSKVEGKLGHQLGGAETQAVKAATLLRNNSLSSVRSGLASKVGGMVGLDGPVVEAMLPMLGF